jgi:hypothetical protein
MHTTAFVTTKSLMDFASALVSVLLCLNAEQEA